MPALFPRSSNKVFRILIGLGTAVIVGLPVLLMGWVRTSFVTGQGGAPEQPVAFSHQLHVKGFQVDCRYCHSTVERSALAGMPWSQTCRPCHSQVWWNGPEFEAVRRSLESGTPIRWIRVNRLPDYVYFNHAVHVTNGVGCETCHGRVDQMARTEQAAPLTMGWCIDCHRHPEPYLRPVSEMTAMGYRPSISQAAPEVRLVHQAGVPARTTCTACHR